MVGRSFRGVAFVFAGLLVLGLLVRLIGGEDSPEERAAREARNWHRGVFSASARVIGETLRDPASAQWRNRTKWLAADENVVVVCGEVNARNAFGGYVGYTPFYSVWRREGSNARHVESFIMPSTATATAAARFERDFRRYCSGRALDRLP